VRRPHAVALAAAAIVAILTAAAVYVFRSVLRAPAELAQEARGVAEEARRVAAAFRKGTLVTRFASEATRLNGASRLQFAELQQSEIFERTDSGALFWGQLQLPDVIVEARAPVTYTYYVDLEKPWAFRRLSEGVLETSAPAIEFNEPAVDPSRIRYVVRKGSVLRDEAAVLERLQQGLTELSRERARQHVAVVRDTGRVKIADFVERWLRERFEDGGSYRVRVSFVDEPSA
jgi:hypothetical protein